LTQLPDFRLETYFSRWEFTARHHLTASDAQTMTMTELLALADLPPELFRRAEMIATDDHAQCLHHGDFGHAVRAGAASEHSDTTIGAILQAPALRSALAITIADLTGIGALDAAVASRLTHELLD
jgi:Predicted ornithine cyclodeaminase, mu-crystallin homolog